MAKIQFVNPDPVHRQLRLLAVLAGRPMADLVRDAVREYVELRAARLPSADQPAEASDA
ncbi:MAG TPA: hypothetical protein VFS43_20700 [Polyangiaceae bacterium]|nr:hypothetical protein [Polyangiaceae bacterium]